MNKRDFTWPGRIQDDPAHDLIIAYLTIDIQSSPKWTEELLLQMNRVKSGQVPSWERVGNAYCLRIYPEYVAIEYDYNDSDTRLQEVTFQDFLKAIKAWQAYIQTPDKK